MRRLGRSVAQPGRALCSGRRGRRFESSHSDQRNQAVSVLPHIARMAKLHRYGFVYSAPDYLPETTKSVSLDRHLVVLRGSFTRSPAAAARLSGEREPAPSRFTAAASYLLARSKRALSPLGGDGSQCSTSQPHGLLPQFRGSRFSEEHKSTHRTPQQGCPMTEKPGAAILRWRG
jgi:hypothetical protein